MDWTWLSKIVEVGVLVWPYFVMAGVVALFVIGISYWYINSDYHKYPWVRNEVKEEKRRAREAERARKAFWGE